MSPQNVLVGMIKRTTSMHVYDDSWTHEDEGSHDSTGMGDACCIPEELTVPPSGASMYDRMRLVFGSSVMNKSGMPIRMRCASSTPGDTANVMIADLSAALHAYWPDGYHDEDLKDQGANCTPKSFV